MKFLPVAAE